MFSEIKNRIEKAEKIAIFNHEHPDGDALGSAYALKLALCKMGKCAEVFLRGGDDETPEYREAKKGEKIAVSASDCDLKIAVDCADRERMGSFADMFCGNTASLDHHATHIPFSDATVVVPSAPAAGEIIYDLICALGVELDSEIAHNLYMAIACDTGSFKYQSTTAKTHRVSAELIETGIDFAGISKRLFDTQSIGYLRAYKMALDKLEIYENGRIALLVMSDSDFESAGIAEREADGIVGLVRSVEGAEVGVYIRQRGEGYKVSLRSTETDVAAVAKGFGGGGHVRASGFSSALPIDELKKETVKAIAKAQSL